jgi:hypothetical protein
MGVGRTHMLPPQKLSIIAVSSEGERPHCHHSSKKGITCKLSTRLSYSQGYLKIGGNTGGCRSSPRSEEVLLRIPPQFEGGSAEQHRRGRPPASRGPLAVGSACREKKDRLEAKKPPAAWRQQGRGGV